MTSVAEVWLADALAGLRADPAPRLLADLHRCSREMGWTPGPLDRREVPYVAHRTALWQRVQTGEQVQMRVSVFAPIIGFVRSSSPSQGWGRPYLDVPRLSLWWQKAGWLVPDPGWLNAPFLASELAELQKPTAQELRRWPTLSRGDALFFEW